MSRRSQLAMIHIGKKQLGLDDETYREMLRNVAGFDSCSDIGAAGLAKVIRHMRSRGADLGGKRPQYKKGTHAALIRHLWTCLNRAGEVVDGSDRALRRWVKRQTKIYDPDGNGFDHPNLVPEGVAGRLVEQLKRWCGRTGVSWE